MQEERQRAERGGDTPYVAALGARYAVENRAAQGLWHKLIEEEPELFAGTELHTAGILRLYSHEALLTAAAALHRATEAWNRGVARWNRAPARASARPYRRRDRGTRVPAIAPHPTLVGELRPHWHWSSTVFNTDAQCWSDLGLPIALVMEHYDIDRQGYHDTHDTLAKTELKVTGSGEDFMVGDAKVVCGNVQTMNATVYIIDSVLLPKM